MNIFVKPSYALPPYLATSARKTSHTRQRQQLAYVMLVYSVYRFRVVVVVVAVRDLDARNALALIIAAQDFMQSKRIRSERMTAQVRKAKEKEKKNKVEELHTQP